MAMDTSTIRAGAEIFTLINVFSVAPDQQQELANVLIEAHRADDPPSARVHLREYSHQS